jgi:5-dehydro-4-deoxyglucarate dehydratase
MREQEGGGLKAASIDLDWVRHAMRGPISAVHPTFTRDGSLDFDGLRREIDHNIAAGSGVQLLTYGDSLHSLLSDGEVVDVLKVVIDQTAGRAMVVAADRAWWLGKEIEFADAARDLGADLLMVLPPTNATSTTHDSLVAHYTAVSEHIPVMLVTGLFGTRPALGFQVMQTLLDTAPNVVAVKDDVVGEFARRMALMAYGRWAILSGGQKQNHLDIHPYGCDGYMSTYLHFMPQVALAYWRAVEANDLAACARIIRDFDVPWFQFAEGFDGGFDAMYHAAQEIFGIAGRWRRLPYSSPSDAEMERLRGFFAALPPVD